MVYNKKILFILVTCLLIYVNANCCDLGAASIFCPHCYGFSFDLLNLIFEGKCVIRENPHKKLRELMEERLFGQNHVIEPMSQMIESWYKRNSIKGSKQSKGDLFSFHIAGDNGVGKTYAVSLLKESLFQYSNSENFLYLSGTNFEGNDPDKVSKYKEIIFNSIISQLEKCSKSLIVLDEVQYVHSSTLRVLQQFLDNSVDFVVKPNGAKIYKNEAIIGLVSDFGREGRTRDMPFEELEAMVVQHTKELWDDPKLHQLITYTYPFVTLTDGDIEDMIRYYVSTLIPTRDFRANTFHSVHASESAVRWIRYKIRKVPDENGRGVDKWLEKRFVPKLQESILDYRYPVYVNVLYKDNDLKFIVHSIHDET